MFTTYQLVQDFATIHRIITVHVMWEALSSFLDSQDRARSHHWRPAGRPSLDRRSWWVRILKLPHQHPQGFHLAQKMAHETRKKHVRILRLMSIEHFISNVRWEIKLTYSDTTCLHLDSHRYRYRLAWRSTTFSLELFCPSLVIIVPRFGNYCPQVWGIIVPKFGLSLVIIVPKFGELLSLSLGNYCP